MADGSAIEWTEATWNPTTGCDRVSAGCDNCYALTLAKRLKAMGALTGAPARTWEPNACGCACWP
jgi:protein gp37